MEKYCSKLPDDLSGRLVITTTILRFAGSWIFRYGIISRVQGKATAAGGWFEEVLYPQRPVGGYILGILGRWCDASAQFEGIRRNT